MRYGLESTLPERAFSPRLPGPFGHGMTLEGGGGSFIADVLPVITVIAAIAIDIYAPGLGEAIFEFVTGMDAIEAVGTGAYTAAEVSAASSAMAAGAVSAGGNAVNTAAAGGDLEETVKAAAVGGAAGAAGSYVGAQAGGAVAEETGSKAAGNIAKGGTQGATSGFTKAELSGQNLQKSLRTAEIGGITGLATSAAGELIQASGATPQEAGVVKAFSGPYIAKEVSTYFPKSTSSSQVSSKSPSSTSPSGGLPTTGTARLGGGSIGGFTPGSSALGQALNVGGVTGSTGGGSSGGYGSKDETLSPETGGAPKNVWNMESLRVKPEEA